MRDFSFTSQAVLLRKQFVSGPVLIDPSGDTAAKHTLLTTNRCHAAVKPKMRIMKKKKKEKTC